LFDLTFVVAVSFASQALHHNLHESHLVLGVVYYLMSFFGVWWAWMNFTWFATSFDTDDWLYRITTIVQMGGALTYAAGIPAFTNVQHPDFTLGVVGYIIMRLPMAFQWFRAARDDPSMRATTLRYAWGILVVQCFWVALLIVPPALAIPTFLVGIVLELLVPVFGESSGATAWHRQHITERYGLFTLIVLGESILASTNAVVDAGAEAETDKLAALVLLAATSLVVIACFWWLYFALPQRDLLQGFATALGWGYGHYVIFASAAALSAAIEIAIDQSEGVTRLPSVTAAGVLSIPCAIYVLFVWLLILRSQSSNRVNTAVPILAIAIALAAFVPFSIQVVAGLLVVTVVVVVSGRDVRTPAARRSRG
ncbi:MAG: low temperature requirement protein, partial [Frondihabitans sp.]|nr:low temperature requirement protein [Frondihabitans sp.]